MKTDKGEPVDVTVTINIQQVKQKDMIVQDAVGLTMIDGKKTELQIPFAKDMTYKFDNLMKNFIFKYAILQSEDILGVLYLEIPFKYKFTKKFKIDDWYPLKPFDKGVTKMIDNSLVARVVISYDSNYKLDPKQYASIEDLKEDTGSPKADYKTKLRKLRKQTTNQSDKENLNYLEEVEKNIFQRRRRNYESAGGSTDKKSTGSASARVLRSSQKTNEGMKG